MTTVNKNELNPVIKKQRFLDWILSATENSEYALK
jgi:hypothetical protein